MITLETERLKLRMLCEADFDAYAQMCADPEVMRYLGDGKPLDRPMAWRNMSLMVGHWSLRGYGMWGVEELTSGQLIGRIGFWNPEGWPEFELGWVLRRSSWGQGYATEGATAALEYAFTKMQRPQVISLIRPQNTPSIRVAERLGEQLHGSVELLGSPALVYRITQNEWQAKKTS